MDEKKLTSISEQIIYHSNPDAIRILIMALLAAKKGFYKNIQFNGHKFGLRVSPGCFREMGS